VPLDEVRTRAQAAKDAGATRFCMGAAWRSPKKRDVEAVAAMIREVRALGMETCATLGMLSPEQARELKDAGLDYYNHNVDTSPEFYGEIITTRTYQDRLDTLAAVRDAGLNVCCGGIVGMGETTRDRASMLATLANLPQHPESVPINQLVRVPGTPLAGAAPVDPFDFVRTIAVARIVMPKASVRLSAGREVMSDELQALCFLAGANSIFYGEKLLTTGNPDVARDRALMTRLGIEPLVPAGLAAGNGSVDQAQAPRNTCTVPAARTRTRRAGRERHATRRGSAEGRARRSRAASPEAAAAHRRRRPGQFLQQRLPRAEDSPRGHARVHLGRGEARRGQRRRRPGDGPWAGTRGARGGTRGVHRARKGAGVLHGLHGEHGRD
jgi:biotin synthase